MNAVRVPKATRNYNLFVEYETQRKGTRGTPPFNSDTFSADDSTPPRLLDGSVQLPLLVLQPPNFILRHAILN